MDNTTDTETTTTVAATTSLVTTDSQNNTNSTVETTVTPTTQQTSSLITSTNTTENQINNTVDESSRDDMKIVGGCIGGILAVVLVLVIVLIFIRRRNKRRNSGNVPVLPDKDLIESIQVNNAVRYHRENQAKEEPEDPTTKQYMNLTHQGETDEQTDPSVGPDGYLKKTKHFLHIGKHKHKKRKGHQNGKKNKKHVTQADHLNDSPIYTNEISTSKEAAKRTDSMPCGPAPPVPRDSSEYAIGRVAGEKKNEIRDDTRYNARYENLPGQKKGVPKTNANVMNEQNDRKKMQAHAIDSQKSKDDKNKHSGNQETEASDGKKVYENVTDGNYYNLKANEKVELQRQSTYEEVGRDSEMVLQQDDVYENP